MIVQDPIFILLGINYLLETELVHDFGQGIISPNDLDYLSKTFVTNVQEWTFLVHSKKA